MDTDLLRSQLEDLEIKSDVIDEIINLQIDNIKNQIAPSLPSIDDKIESIKEQIKNEPNWKKRASLAAKIITTTYDDLR